MPVAKLFAGVDLILTKEMLTKIDLVISSTFCKLNHDELSFLDNSNIFLIRIYLRAAVLRKL